MKVDVVNLKKHFAKARAVDGISFSFETGQVVGFVGPNGAGKTTTMRIMATLDEATEGDAFVDGVSVTEDPEKVRRLVGFVPDALPAHTGITVHEYLDFFARAYGLKGARRRTVVEGVEEFTGLTGMRDKLLSALSKGMQQRVSVGRSLVHDPTVLILDEPAAGLDPRARIELRELLHVLSEQNKAIFISSHILSELREICTGVVIIEQGRLLETGTIGEVVQRSMPKRTLMIRPLSGQDEVAKALLEMPGIENVRPAGAEVLVEVDGSEERCAEILADLIRRGYRIAEFKQRRAELEEVFMSITKGELQ
ncbi:MAG: ABC transporter ATP-binding protein [Kiritimatiellae bacterium]|nr:ABC transporter ATP-binding protein [Kiritimatiellia bacterium]